jgi:hypothetical protein
MTVTVTSVTLFEAFKVLLEDVHVEGVLDVAEVFAEHLLAETLARDEHFGHRRSTVLHEALLDEELDAFLGFPSKVKTINQHLFYFV